jgi:hypothetical protein
MAGVRQPGSEGTSGFACNLDDGTSIRALTPPPGTTGNRHAPAGSLLATGGNPERVPTLRRGSDNRFVKLLQAQLNARLSPSPGLNVDGHWGPLTQAAVLRYQKALRLVTDGVVGPATWATLLKGNSASDGGGPDTTGKAKTPLVKTYTAVASSTSTKTPLIADTAKAAKLTAPGVRLNVGAMTLDERFTSVLNRTVGKLPSSIQGEFAALLSPTSLAILVGSLVAWAISHAFGVGEVIDVILLVGGAVALGFAAFDVGKHLGHFLSLTASATTEEELNGAADHLAKAIAIMGVAAFVALVTKAAGKSRGGGKGKGNAAAAEAEEAAAANKGAKEKGKAPTTPFDYYMDLVETLNVSTPKNSSIFYSGPGNRAAAEAFAAKTGKFTLEQTPGGKMLNDLKLYDADSPLTAAEADNIWARLSVRYAQQASGEVTAFVEGAKPDRIFLSVEKPILEANPNVTAIIMGGK